MQPTITAHVPERPSIEERAADPSTLDAPLVLKLGYRGAARYLSSNYEKVGTKWDWRHDEPGCGERAQAPNVALDIAVAMRRSPSCKLAIIGGRCDAATTFWNVVHDMSCQYLSPELKERVSWYRYGCGHMAYTDVPTLEAMGEDLHEWYQRR